ncbi:MULTISPECIES: murein biosynthesis integral membrane protein MurJ [unclassified Campylobacter]|uniref:murein biosynthesis integral membrane protein MurJ n=1 Tax=unclassified Campylobacter TaxID=2593542 RepID=UPI0014737BC0|nr:MULTISPECIES: murein biosynthesis integral membrane protein MurJ [unclassified Campylobacter]
MFIRGFFSNSAGIMVSRILGFFRDVMTASTLGAGIYSDIFFIAFKIPNLFRRIFAEGAFGDALLPNFTHSKNKSVFSAEIFLKFLFFVMILTLLVNLFAPQFTKIIATGLNESQISQAIPLVKINFYYLGLIYVVTFIATLLQYRQHFITTAFSTALLNIAMIFALVLAQGKEPKVVAYYLSFGVAAGGILQVISHLIALYLTSMSKIFFGGIIKFIKGKRADTKGFFANFYHGLFGSSAMQISSFMDTWLASFLVSGSISYLFYANRIFQLPLAVFAIALSTALFPKIARNLKAGNEKEALKFMNKGFETLFFLLFGAAIGGFVLADPIIKLLFERGQFNAQDTTNTALVLKAYMIGLVPFGLAKIFSKWLHAKMQQKTTSKIAVITLIINLILAVILMKYYGAFGLALASSIGGFALLILTIRAFGTKRFLAIINFKRLGIMAIILFVEVIILIFLRKFIDANF